MSTVGGKGLLDIVKGLISKVIMEILTTHGVCPGHHNLKVFSNKASTHGDPRGDLLIRKEFLLSVLKDCCKEQSVKVTPQ